jgi:predicted metal-dependent phosphoesterase TrpH
MPFIVDLHVHTTAGSADSSLRPAVLRQRAAELRIEGVHISEHFRVWTEYEALDWMRETPVRLFRGMEWNTELGHILVLGVDAYRPEIRSIAELRRFVLDQGGLMIAAHPFRHAFDRVPSMWKAHPDLDLSLESACAHPVIEYVDAIEVLNGACTERENDLACRVARRLGLPGTGGSDAHYADDLGRAVTVLDEPVTDERELIAAIRAGRLHAAPGPV